MKLKMAGIVGTVTTEPFPHQNIYGYGNIYALVVEVARNSGAIDNILILLQEDKIDEESFGKLPWNWREPGSLAALIKAGDKIEVTGAIQTYKDKDTGHTPLFIWAHYLAAIPDTSQDLNEIHMNGIIAKAPVHRVTPKGRKITETILCVPSDFSSGFYSYIPCITWGRTADKVAELPEGTAVYIEGRMQSRDYIKRTPDGEIKKTTREVSVSKIRIDQEERRRDGD